MEPLELDLTRCLTFVLMFVLFQCPLCMEPLELDLTRCLTFVDVCFVSVSTVYGATRVGLDSMSDVC